jgi:hypothetical protein
MSSGSGRCGNGVCPSSTTAPAIVYFPPGCVVYQCIDVEALTAIVYPANTCFQLPLSHSTTLNSSVTPAIPRLWPSTSSSQALPSSTLTRTLPRDSGTTTPTTCKQLPQAMGPGLATCTDRLSYIASAPCATSLSTSQEDQRPNRLGSTGRCPSQPRS